MTKIGAGLWIHTEPNDSTDGWVLHFVVYIEIPNPNIAFFPLALL